MLNGLVEANASVVGLRVNQTVTYEDLLYSTKKANYADVLKIMSTMSPYDQLMTSLKKKYFGNINVFVAWILLLMPIILLSFFRLARIQFHL